MARRLRPLGAKTAVPQTMMITVTMMMMVVMTVEGTVVNRAERSGRTKRSEETEAEWSTWFNSDRPWSGEGDFETTDNIQTTQRICNWDWEVVGAQCRVSGTNDSFDSSTTGFLEDHLLQACSSHGLICLNSQQPSGLCHDYEVRFLCQALQVDDDSDSLFPNLDFKIYILLAAVPLLVITLRLLWSCWCKPRLDRRRQQRQGRGQQHQQRGSLASGSLSTSSSQASFDSTLAHPPPAYTELFGEGQAPHPVVFSISGGAECAGCGKCLHHQPYLLSQGGGGVESSSPGEGESVPGDVASSPPPPASPDALLPGGDDVFVTPTSQAPEGTVTSQTAARSSETSQAGARSSEPVLRPSSASVSSLQGAAALPLPPAPQPDPAASSSSPAPVQCTCACHRLPSGHVNLAFQWDSSDQVDSSAPGLPPGMHKPVFSFQRIGSATSFTSFTSLPDYEEALEILKKSGLFLEEEKV